MKQIIVLVATIALGLAIAQFITGFGDTAETLANDAKRMITYEGLAGN